MPAELSQHDGLTMTILPCPRGRSGCIQVRLTGTAMQAEITSEKFSADIQQPLDAFFASVAQIKVGVDQDWLSESQDFSLSATLDPFFPGFIYLRVYLGSTSDDACDWQMNGSFLVTPEQVSQFAKALLSI
ncbi:hypothetical protein C1X59_17120 [Pseudomonas sp. FW215-R2]|jgi:hypothetical protein|uniref:hypothetical protein n=1 Tax=Pseudomonas TaxID=286 RepID=UPI000BDAAA06|nr:MULTISPECIES: hypothetical protein [Pseudomonas]PCR94475.1 hypothetical protein CP336_21510 [Pseudomonas fluorescens]PMW99542.1 hypothetical protein C1X59_17120 [Pseudomonas sp. FW215-R2]PMX07430.1 hypothetical protein C1X60_20620 [Pseudomonas sp. FW215-L1]PMX20263.1 hypothetical protein C1X57_21540 [Pseudomonas sp. FW215-E1]PNA27374.1 hypothetical protein C1X58_18985 [Pseudomonas sp. FW215-R4]